MNKMIEFHNISKIYHNNTIISDLNLSIEKGEFLTVIGSSGCGKTTLLKMINGLIKPEYGEVIVDDKNIENVDLIELRRHIGYCIQGSVLFPHMTVEENIAYVPRLLNKKKIKQIVNEWMDIVGLNHELLERYPDELSGGQQQRVAIARAIASSPHILLMDEPFGAVDSITRSQLQKEIKDIHQKTKVTIIFVTHDIQEALFLGTKVLVLDKGQIQQYDTPHQIINHPANTFVRNLLDNSTKYQDVNC